ncbi:hypothetical protein K3495_g9926 [Podosphaera aphanis]|nr:hypothetical protein K3495_g9926 [Podosphaera aphanis]
MRSPRIIIVAAFFLTAILLTYISLWPSQLSYTKSIPPSSSQTGILAFFSLRPPFSFFPPNALITLTHDNTTAFLAKPAAFGPLLPKNGLKARVWIGGGFGDVATGGELGCSDVPGWEDRFSNSVTNSYDGVQIADTKQTRRLNFEFSTGTAKTDSLSKKSPADFSRQSPPTMPSTDDGTDDHLHHPLPKSKGINSSENPSHQAKLDHADIQSLQEGAEISGKIVLLSRGGCGFLEKAKWSQRRGAVALIVGDDSKGGPLIQMFAKGDTSSITIPSIFTSYTTAHLLCSLVGPGLFTEETTNQEVWRPISSSKIDRSSKIPRKKLNSHPTFTSSAVKPAGTKITQKNKGYSEIDDESLAIPIEKPGWLKSIFFGVSSLSSKYESSRPPSSGQLEWLLTDQQKDDDGIKSKKESVGLNPHSFSKNAAGLKSTPFKSSDSRANLDHDFVIGVQDWRDPDLAATTKNSDTKLDEKESQTTRFTKSKAPTKNSTLQPPKKQQSGAFQNIPDYFPNKGGIITPSSGEYTIYGSHHDQDKKPQEIKAELNHMDSSKGIFNIIFGDDNKNAKFPSDMKSSRNDNHQNAAGEENNYEELWITLTPSTGASPFFETLLVLVVSPLVTLTIVYALLLIRSRTRRRRWRAPKSVVARLPVRTYQSITSPGAYSPRLASPCSMSVTAPLLQNMPKPRPRSQTISGIPESCDLIRNSSPRQSLTNAPRKNEHEKTSSESSEWIKHMGKQVECVVCLEEYVDGVSRVMGLPCGHEFHVDCITPWLTTRRRTCPICKGDVLRSLAGNTGFGNRHDTLQDENIDEEGAHPRENQTSPSNLLSAATNLNTRSDVELGATLDSLPHHSRINITESLRGLLPSSFRSRPQDSRSVQQDRNR